MSEAEEKGGQQVGLRKSMLTTGVNVNVTIITVFVSRCLLIFPD